MGTEPKGYIIGGLESGSLHTLADALIGDANKEDRERPSEIGDHYLQRARPVNTRELRELAQKIVLYTNKPE